jgi:multiple antibiotic resistance protein
LRQPSSGAPGGVAHRNAAARGLRPDRRCREASDNKPRTALSQPMPLEYLVSAIVTLLVVVDPLGLTPAFVAVTSGLPNAARRQVAGLLLFSIASEMVFGVRMERQSRTAEQAIEEHVRNIAAFPLATPLLAGPGAITATTLLSGQAALRPAYLAILNLVIIAVAAVCVVVFLFASRVDRALGTTGNVLLSRLLGVLLAALAVQYVIDGLRAVLAG